jgi:hypothetical protein
LIAGGVDFILAGGVAGALRRVPVSTLEIGVVPSMDVANIERLRAVLESLDAVFRSQPERRLKPTASHLAGSGPLAVVTRYGPLDVLGTIGLGLAYEELLPQTVSMDIGGGTAVRVLDLERQ